MQISDALEVGIGLSFIFFLSSLVLASIHEMIETVLKVRGAYLFDGITELVRDPNLATEAEEFVKEIYQHPQIRGLMQGDVGAPGFKWKLPSYIPTSSFALALIDKAAKGQLSEKVFAGVAPAGASPVQRLRMMAEGIRNEQVRTALIQAAETAGDDIDAVTKNLEHWFDSAMDRVSGWYKRRSQRIIFALGLVTALLLNVNTVVIAQSLATSAPLRHAVAEVARVKQEKCTAATCTNDPVPSIVGEMAATNMPVGWTDGAVNAMLAPVKTSNGAETVFWWIAIAVGYFLTAFAVTLGAPFWFDLLGKLMVIRATVKPQEKSQDEASKDPQPASGGGPVINVLPAAQPLPPAGPSPPVPPDGAIYVEAAEAVWRLFEDDAGQAVAGLLPSGQPQAVNLAAVNVPGAVAAAGAVP